MTETIELIHFFLLPTCLKISKIVFDKILRAIFFTALTGLIAGGAKGFLRLFKCEASCVIDLIPVDYAVNLIIAVAWHQATTK